MPTDTELPTIDELCAVNPTYDCLVSDLSSESARLIVSAAASDSAYPILAAFEDPHRVQEWHPYTAAAAEERIQPDLVTDRTERWDVSAFREALHDLFHSLDLSAMSGFPEIRVDGVGIFQTEESPDEECDTSALKAFLDGIEVRKD